MCEPIQGFILCSCFKDRPVIHHKNSRRHKKKRAGEPQVKQYNWHLLRYEGTFDSGEVGRVIMPSHSIGNGLTDEFVQEKLNSGNCFDFDFVPREKDSLMIQEDGVQSPYLGFYFKNGRWEIGYGFSAFDDIMKDFGKGMVKLL